MNKYCWDYPGIVIHDWLNANIVDYLGSTGLTDSYGLVLLHVHDLFINSIRSQPHTVHEGSLSAIIDIDCNRFWQNLQWNEAPANLLFLHLLLLIVMLCVQIEPFGFSGQLVGCCKPPYKLVNYILHKFMVSNGMSFCNFLLQLMWDWWQYIDVYLDVYSIKSADNANLLVAGIHVMYQIITAI
jgi:hypothetical protein